jgi:hypothetical protein
MLLRLPTELIERTIRLSLPAESTSTTYADRQTTLRNLCLVNSRLRDIAQPVLRERVVILSPEVWASVLKQSRDEGWASRVRFLSPSVQDIQGDDEDENEGEQDRDQGVSIERDEEEDDSSSLPDGSDATSRDDEDIAKLAWPDLHLLRSFSALRHLGLHDTYDLRLKKLEALPSTSSMFSSPSIG